MRLRTCLPVLFLLAALPWLLATAPGRADTLAPGHRRPVFTDQPFAALPVANVAINLKEEQGDLETWRHTVGQGGINPDPLPGPVVAGIARLHPRLVRVFIQEFFFVYPEHGRYDWSRLDPYMDALARTGARVVAAITLKPRPIYPRIDQAVWQPADRQEWQRVIAALVKRYSVDKPIVTYWEVGNETDIGENGGCPYLIRDPAQYAEFYKMTIEPILATFPGARVGGCGVANAAAEYLPRFVELCLKDRTRLDFISWHLYSDDPAAHAGLVARYRKLLEPFGDKRPEMLVTEWNKDFDPVSVEEMAFAPRRAAAVAASLVALTDARVDWSFYYHACDQVARHDDFKLFFQDPGIMYHHWNEVPHRFGLFGVDGEVRPQYFVYRMLARMGRRRVSGQSDTEDLRLLASRDPDRATLFVANYGRPASRDRIAALSFSGLTPGRKRLTTFRLDSGLAWSDRSLELNPAERREVDVQERFSCQVFCPADSVTLVVLEDSK